MHPQLENIRVGHGQGILEWLADACDQFRERIAIEWGNQGLSYGALDGMANRIANYLVANEVSPGSIAVVMLDDRIATIAALLGIFRAGAVFVPLDGSSPEERLHRIVADLSPDVFIIGEAYRDKVNAIMGRHERTCKVIPLGRWSRWAPFDDGLSPVETALKDFSAESPARSIDPDALRYIYYTSGSTGQPKGIAGRLASLSHFIQWEIETFNIDVGWRVSQFISPTFDAYFRDILVPLCAGGTVCIPPDSPGNLRTDVLIDWIDSGRIGLIHCVPSLLQAVLGGNLDSEKFKSLKYVLLSGEALHVSVVKRWMAVFGDRIALVNLYGSTETTMVKFFHIVQQADLSRGFIPIGKPMKGARALVLDDRQRVCPPGVTGEIYIRTPFRTLGYYNNPDATKEVFIQNPFNDHPDDLIYRTGDLGLILNDGNFRFLGRQDNQVKIRGVRVELGEIENHLLNHPLVGAAVVLACEDVPGDVRLAAYIVAKQKTAPSIKELRDRLKQELPDYMVPSAFVFLDSLPFTPNGKVDRQALPASSQSRAELGESFVAPRTPVEEVLGGIWARLLRVEQAGIHDNFFDLGGHSLLATQVVSKLREAFGVELPLRFLFDAPTVAGLAERIESARRSEQGLTAPPIERVSREGDLPLSFAQQRLWFLDQLEPGSIAYNITGAARLTGPLNIAALEQSLTEVLRRHEVLRTTFRAVDGQPFQSLAPAKPFILPVVDLEHLPEAEREAEARRLATEQAHQSFDLAKGPLFRASLLRLGEEDHIVQCAMHHTVSDGWSMTIFNKEIGSLYHSFSTGQPSSLPELAIQYADFAHWQREWLQGEVLEAQLSYWRKQLAGAPPSLELPTDRPRPAVQTFHGARQSLVLPKSLTEALKGLSRQEGVTLFMTLLAAFKVLLCRYTGEEDIVVGTPIAGRNRAEIEPLIGFFINTLVLRTDLSGGPSFRELLRRVRDVTLGAYDHQELPFEKLVEELQPERDLSRTPLFQVFFNMLNLESLEGHRPELCGLTAEPLLLERDSKFDLTFYARERDEEMHLTLVYNADLFCQDRMVETQEQFKHLLFQITENPDKKIAQLSLLTRKAEAVLPNPAQELRTAWLGAIHTRFSQQAKRVPEQIAVLSERDTWSYGELESRSNQLANYLIASGLQSGEIVAIYARRSAALVWALLGILKAGGSFLIVDPSYPAERLRSYLRVAEPMAWIALEGVEIPTDIFADDLSTLQCRCHLVLPQFKTAPDHDPLACYPDSDPSLLSGPDHRAYVVFTSGTSGKPKAIEGTHSPLSHFLKWHCQTFRLKETDRFSMLSGLSHDPLLRDVFMPLWLGATLCIPDVENMSPGELVDWIKRYEVSVVHLTPAMSEVLVQGLAGGGSTSLRYVFFGGDVLTGFHTARIKTFAPEATCVNFYGATETPQAMSYFVVPERNDHSHTEAGNSKPIVPLGRGIEGAQLLVLNRGWEVAGVGELGEICVRSPYLAKGYMKDEALTHARFLTNPFTGVSTDRLYTTGDLGRYRPDGDVEFAGRADSQVKIRGFRIELGEIEAMLCRNLAVRQSVVLVRQEISGDKRLVAYIVPEQGQALAANDLRDFVRKELPEYMVPSAFVFLNALPLTTNGKVDRRALPPPDSTRRQEKELVAPRDELELQLTKIWERFLKIRPIGITDNFFDLGGHSLLAVRLFAQIEKMLGKNLPVAALFQAPTIEQLARLIGREGSRAQWKSLVAIQPGGSRPPFFCVHAHDGGVLFWRDLARHLGSDQPFYALQPQGLDGRQPLHSRIEEMAAHYIKEIRTLQAEGPYFIGGHCIGGLMAFEMAQQLHALGEKVALLALFDSFAPRREKSARISLVHRYRYRAICFFERTIRLHIGNLSVLGPKERLPYIKGKLNKAVHKIYMAIGSRWIPAARNHRMILEAGSRASRSYHPKAYPGKITLFRATDLGGGISHDPQMGWGRLAAGGLEAHMIPGYHAHIVLEPRVRVLAEKLAACLDSAWAAALKVDRLERFREANHDSGNENWRSRDRQGAFDVGARPSGRHQTGAASRRVAERSDESASATIRGKIY